MTLFGRETWVIKHLRKNSSEEIRRNVVLARRGQDPYYSVGITDGLSGELCQEFSPYGIIRCHDIFMTLYDIVHKNLI